MTAPIEITVRDLTACEETIEWVKAQAKRLVDFSEHATWCRVVVEQPHRRHRKGRRYRVTVDLAVPGEVVVGTGDDAAASHEDLETAVSDAFGSVRRQLRERHRVRGWHRPHVIVAQAEPSPAPA